MITIHGIIDFEHGRLGGERVEERSPGFATVVESSVATPLFLFISARTHAHKATLFFSP